jgi:hypothetical protein
VEAGFLQLDFNLDFDSDLKLGSHPSETHSDRTLTHSALIGNVCTLESVRADRDSS